MADTEQNRQGENRSGALTRTGDYPIAPGGSYYRYPEDEELHLRDYLQVILRRKWIVITFFVAVVTTVTIGTFMMKPLFKSTATIKIDKENPNILKFKDIYAVERTEEDYYQTQYKILKSRNLAKRVIRRMKLASNPEFSDTKKAEETVKPASFLTRDSLLKDDSADSGLVDSVIQRIEVTPQRKSRLVDVSFMSFNPELAARVTEAIAQSFIELNIESKFEATQQARTWLEKQLETMKAKVEQSEEQLNEYAARNEIIFFDHENSGTKNENIITKRLAELSTELTVASADRISREALYNEISSGDPASSSLVISNELILSLKKDYAKIDAEYNKLLKTYKPEYPKMVDMRELLNQLESKTDRETKKIVLSIQKDYRAAVKRENYLKKAFEQQKLEALNLNSRSVQYQILRREADTNKELYNGLLESLKETGISASLTASNIQILDTAEVPRYPFKPKKGLNILLSLIVGLFGGVGLAFFAEYLDNTVKTPEDIEKKTYMPSLGLVPLYTAGKHKLPVELISYDQEKNPLSEAYTSLRTYLLFSTAGKPPKVMLITSPRKEEGKTTTVINTAISLTKSGSKVIILDADMRKPRLHKIFKQHNTVGLSSFLSGNTEFDESMLKKTPIKNLEILPAGPVPPNPAELLSSSRFREIIDAFYPLCDFMLIDSPPVLGMADAAIASTQTDGVILVVKSGETPRDAVQQAKKMIESVNAKVLGVVINAMREPHMKYGYYSYYQSYYQNYGADAKK
jgi:capsular exopolysaccharide synthesis family protein